MPIPTDPLLAEQWHLNQTILGLLDLNVLGVWNPTMGPAYTGAGTRTLVIDDGFDYLHQDFDNYDQSLDFDFEFNTLDPFGLSTQSQGTAVAGIIGAAADGTGAVGVAFDTSLVGYRVAGLINDAWLQDIRDAISNAATNAQADVANISQNIANDTASEFGNGYLAIRFDEIETSIGTAVDTGRGGLGMSIVKSAGNSRVDNYDVNADDWTNDTRQVVVGAVNQNGFVSSNSSYGAALLVSAFGTPGEVVTTDRTGAAGSNLTDFRSDFNGTGAAAAMVTGVVSLMYDANAGLGWRDVQSILAVSARQVGSEVGAGIAGSERHAWQWNAAQTWNGGGQHFSNDYGYGLVDALAAVRLAETWLLTGTGAAVTTSQFTNTMDALNVLTVIPDGNATGLSFSGNAAFDDTVERVTVQMAFSTTFTADMEVYLTSPDGTVSLMMADTGGSTDFNGTWTFESQAFRGERAAGQWTVRVVDDAGGDVLTVTDIVIRTFGDFSADDRYVFTNEYSDYAGISGHATAITDSNSGIDTINAAAVTSASTINLGGVSTIDGVGGITFANIENAIGGDGGDLIIGSGGNNSLWGMRGNDTIRGGADADTLDGGANGAGGDTVDYTGSGGVVVDLHLSTATGSHAAGDVISGFENVTGSSGVDTIVGSAVANILNGGAGTFDTLSYTHSNAAVNVNLATNVVSGGHATGDTVLNFERVTGSTLADTIRGSSGVNLLAGGNGNDLIFGEDGADTLNGGNNNDALFGGLGADAINGGSGVDTVHFSSSLSAVTVNLLTGTGSGGEAAGDTYVNVEYITGSNFGDVLTAGTFASSLSGRGGDDILTGSAVNDRITGGTGADTINGLGGLDQASYAGSTAAVQINLNVLTQAGGDAQGDKLTSIENITGSELADTITGNSVANALSGAGGADRLSGGIGNDVLTGGTGSDSFVFAAGHSGQTATTLDRISDYAKGAVGVGDEFDFTSALLIGGSAAAATATQASINAATGVATFLAGSGTTLADALADITARMTAAGTAAGEFAFFEINGTGDNYLFISDAVAGVSANDDLIRLTGITTINTINITAGDVTILT